MSMDIAEKYIQDKVLEIIEKDTTYNELNSEILRVEKDLKKEFTKDQHESYKKLEALVIKSITHILFSACKSVPELRPSTPL